MVGGNDSSSLQLQSNSSNRDRLRDRKRQHDKERKEIILRVTAFLLQSLVEKNKNADTGLQQLSTKSCEKTETRNELILLFYLFVVLRSINVKKSYSMSSFDMFLYYKQTNKDKKLISINKSPTHCPAVVSTHQTCTNLQLKLVPSKHTIYSSLDNSCQAV